MKTFLKYFLCLTCLNIVEAYKVNAQNLVPNPGFEIYSSCPNSYGQINNAEPWFQPNTLGSSTDYYNQCDTGSWGVPNNWGGGIAHSGIAYCGIVSYGPIANYREYIEVLLIDTLKTNKKYCIDFYVSLSDSCAYATSTIGAYFSIDTVSTYGNAISPNSPQVINSTNNPLINKMGWTKVSGCFIAIGGEKYLTIGNFFDNANSDIVYVGDCGSNSGGWCAGAYYFIDDVSVVADTTTGIGELQKDNMKFEVYPNPAESEITVVYYGNIKQIMTLNLYNLLGVQVGTHTFDKGSNTMKISLSNYQSGIYFYKIISEDKIITEEKLIILKR